MIASWFMTSPHWVGLWAALALILGLSIWQWRTPAERRKPWTKLWVPAIVGSLVLGLFGSGSIGVEVLVQKPLHVDTPLQRLDDEQRAAAFATLTSTEYLQSMTQREATRGDVIECTARDLERLDHRVESYAMAEAEGFSMSPRPDAGLQVLRVHYRESLNMGLKVLALADHSDCDTYVQISVWRDLDTLAALILANDVSAELGARSIGLKHLRAHAWEAPGWALAHLPETIDEALADELAQARARLEEVLALSASASQAR